MRLGYVFIAVRGERLALSRLKVGTGDASPGAPIDEILQVYGIDEQGRVAMQIWFDLEDMDAAMAELDAAHARFEAERPPVPHLDNACVRVVGRLWDAFDREAWDEVEQQFATEIAAEHRRKIVGFSPRVLSPSDWASRIRHVRANGAVRHSRAVVAVRGDRLALTRFEIGTADASPGAPQDELLHLSASTTTVVLRCSLCSTSKILMARSPNSTPCTPDSGTNATRAAAENAAFLRTDVSRHIRGARLEYDRAMLADDVRGTIVVRS